MSYSDVYQAIKGLILQNAAPYTQITDGATPLKNGIGFALTSGSNAQYTFFDRGEVRTINMVINAKHTNLKTAMDALSNIHDALRKLTNYPAGDGWQILSAGTLAPPNLIERDQSNNWLVGSAMYTNIYNMGV